MFRFLKEKLGKVFDKFKKEEAVEEKEIEKKAKEETEEIKEIEQTEKKLEIRKEELKEKLEEKKDKEVKRELEEVSDRIGALEEKKGFFEKLKEKLSGTVTKEEFEELFQDIELILIENNLSMKVIEDFGRTLEKEIVGKSIKKDDLPAKIKELLKKSFEEILIEPFDLIEKIKEKKDGPFVIVFFGINGTGKTTTIAKVANLLKKNKISSVIAASDTFRAASIEQIEKHAKALDIKLIKHDYGSDPAAVAFDAIAHAKSRGINAVLIDTAGRMHTKADLMKEMEKICRVSKPDLKIFVGESIVGNDVLEQAGKFNEMIGIDASILTKADVDEKGGAMISIGKITGKPIIYIGTGQKYDDLEAFDPQKIIKSIF